MTIFYRHLLAYPVRVIALIIVIVIAASVSNSTPLLFQRLIDSLNHLTAQDPNALWIALRQVILLGLITLAGWLTWRVAGFLTSSLQPRVRADLERSAMDALGRHSYRFFTDEFTGSLVRRVRSFPAAFVDILESVLWRVLPLIVDVTFMFVVFTRLHIAFTLILVAWIGIMGTKTYFFVRKKAALDLERAAKDSAATGMLADIIGNMLNVQLFTAHAFERQNFFRVTEDRKRIVVRSWRYGEWMMLFQNVLSAGLLTAVLGVLAWLWSQGRVAIGMFAVAVLYISRLTRSMDDLGNAMRRIYEAFAEAAEMTAIMLQKPEIVDRRGASILGLRRGQIEFQHVSFSYRGTASILKDIHVRIAAREKVALVGPSGAGKTTMMKLLLRFFDVTEGGILIDKQDISKVTQESLHRSIALVPQEPILFHRSLMDNIRYGRQDATDAEVVEAARQAHCHEFIVALPDGYATMVGERGVKLSGGERQRVAIARAILKNAPVLVLDEATSSLDSESEALIQDALRQLMKNKTVIVIAHRLSTIMQMDRIIVMEDGQITDMGTHEQLLQKEGMYRTLWNIQAGGFLQDQT